MITKHPHWGVRQTKGTIWCPPSCRLIKYLKQLYSKCSETSVKDCNRPSLSDFVTQFLRSLSGSGLMEIKNRCMGDSDKASNWTEKRNLHTEPKLNFQSKNILNGDFWDRISFDFGAKIQTQKLVHIFQKLNFWTKNYFWISVQIYLQW